MTASDPIAGPRRSALLAGLLATLALPAGAAAQQQVIVLVLDERSQPLEGAVGRIGEATAASPASGLMVFGGLMPGRYELTVRAIGYQSAVREVEVGAIAPARVIVKLDPAVVILPPVIVEGRRTGLYGIVTNDRLEPLEGARVELLGRRGRPVETDAAGEFDFPLAVGANLLRITHPGYRERRFSITIPEGGGQEVLVHLAGDDGRGRVSGDGELAALRDLRSRLAWGNRRDVMTRDDLARFGDLSICDMPILNTVARDQRGTTLGVVDGWEVTWNVCSFTADEVELVEWGGDVCQDPTGQLVRLFRASCRAMQETRGFGGSRRAAALELPGYLIVWTRW